MSYGVGCRHNSDPALLWLLRRLVATAPIRPLAGEPPHAVGAAQETAKRKKKKKSFLNHEYEHVHQLQKHPESLTD